MNWNNVEKLSDPDFKRAIGISRSAFNLLYQAVSTWYAPMGTRHRPRLLSFENQILLFLAYYREYRTFFHIGLSFGVSETTAYRIFKNIEAVAAQTPAFQLPQKLETADFQDIEVVVVDATEIEIERPTKNQQQSYSGKKKSIPQKFSF